jgi:hypothetical protein
MPRPLTPQEETYAQLAWPRMNVSGVVVTDEVTPRYNCLAWTLGISTSWIWPWGLRKVAKAEFDVLFRSFGWSPSDAGPVAVFGINQNDMTHGSISGSGHGPRWESKCGKWLRIQHGLAELEGGVLYGNVVGSYARPVTRVSGRDDPLTVVKAMKTEKLTKADLRFLHQRAAAVDPTLGQRFEAAYAAWKKACDHPLIAMSSNPLSRTHTPEFLELIALGTDILPLIMEKLTDPDEFFALAAVDRLIRPEFVVSHEPDDPVVLLGEQGRALETVKQWIRTQA